MILETTQSDTNSSSATAVAHANIALIKYWGKRHKALNLPAVGSISLTLDALKTETTVHFGDSFERDVFLLNGKEVTNSRLTKITDFLNLTAGTDRSPATIISHNNFPTAAGLASSASGFAALTLAVAAATHQDLDAVELSTLARQGSGSAARSIYGGFVEMRKGNTDDGRGDFAVNLFDESYWDLRMLIAVTSNDEKSISSTGGMNLTAKTSPYYSEWISAQEADLAEMRTALYNKDFGKVGELTEFNCFKMHALALSAQPAIIYWNTTTLETIQLIQELRQQGHEAYLTMDAGPQVKILCLPETAPIVHEALKTIKGIKSILECKPGPAASLKTSEKVYN